MVLGMEPSEIATLFEAYAMLGLKGVAKNENERKTFLKGRAGRLIKQGLGTFNVLLFI
jgi:hypothetical protein